MQDYSPVFFLLPVGLSGLRCRIPLGAAEPSEIPTFELSSSGGTLARSSLSLLGAIMCFILSVDFASLSLPRPIFFFRFLRHVQSHISGKRVFFFSLPTYLAPFKGPVCAAE